MLYILQIKNTRIKKFCMYDFEYWRKNVSNRAFCIIMANGPRDRHCVDEMTLK